MPYYQIASITDGQNDDDEDTQKDHATWRPVLISENNDGSDDSLMTSIIDDSVTSRTTKR